MQFDLTPDNSRCELTLVLQFASFIFFLGRSAVLWDALDFACFQELESNLRLFLGSQQASSTLEPETVTDLLDLLVPKCNDSLGFDSLFSVHEADLQEFPDSDEVTRLKKILASHDDLLVQKLQSEGFSRFIERLREMKLSSEDRRKYSSILEILNLRPQTASPSCKRTKSTECPLALNQVVLKPFLLFAFSLSYLQFFDLRHKRHCTKSILEVSFSTETGSYLWKINYTSLPNKNLIKLMFCGLNAFDGESISILYRVIF